MRPEPQSAPPREAFYRDFAAVPNTTYRAAVFVALKTLNTRLVPTWSGPSGSYGAITTAILALVGWFW